MKLIFVFLLEFIFMLSCFGQDSIKINKPISLGYNSTTGNYTSYTVTSKIDFSRTSKKYQTTWSPTFIYSKQNGKLIQREEYSPFYQSFKINKKDKIIIFNEVESSYLRKINYRFSLGIGLSHVIIKNGNIYLDISQAILPEYMNAGGIPYNFVNKAQETAVSIDVFSLRSSTRSRFEYRINNIKIVNIVLLQPSCYTKQIDSEIISFKNNLSYRINTNVDISVAKNISLGVGNQIIYQTYNHYINNNIKKIDTNLLFYVKLFQ